MEVGINSYELDVTLMEKKSEIPATSFRLLDHKVNGAVLELLVEYSSQGFPDIQALLDEKTGRLFLVGGKSDAPVEQKTTRGTQLVFAKSNQARISIDLATLAKTLGKKGWLEIFKRNPAIFAKEPPQDPIKVCDASDEVLMKIDLPIN